LWLHKKPLGYFLPKRRFIAAKINPIAGLERNVKRQKLTKARIYVGPPSKKPLSVRYAEVLRLREAIIQTQAGTKQPKPDRHTSG
jgi:hypothetical protein